MTCKVYTLLTLNLHSMSQKERKKFDFALYFSQFYIILGFFYYVWVFGPLYIEQIAGIYIAVKHLSSLYYLAVCKKFMDVKGRQSVWICPTWHEEDIGFSRATSKVWKRTFLKKKSKSYSTWRISFSFRSLTYCIQLSKVESYIKKLVQIKHTKRKAKSIIIIKWNTLIFQFSLWLFFVDKNYA